MLHHLGIPLPHEDVVSKAKNSYIKSAYYKICVGYRVNVDETWMNRDWFCIRKYGIFSNGSKATKRSIPDDPTRRITSPPKGLQRLGFEKVSTSVKGYIYLVLPSQAEAISSIAGYSASAVDAQQVFKSTFKAVINEDCSIRA